MIASLVVALLLAQHAAQQPIETAHVAMKTSAVSRGPSGRRVSLALEITPKPKMHVYSPGQEGFIPITMTLEENPAFTAAKARYPAGEKLFMPALNETQLVYARPFAITQDITFKERPSAPLTIKGRVRYQACDDRICYLPQTVAVEWTVGK